MVGCRCSELETRCVELESELARKKSEHEALEARFRSLVAEKAAIEEKLKALEKENENKNKVVDLTEDPDDEDGGDEEEETVAQLMIENSVLQCEKRIAESQVEVLKRKLNDLESKFKVTPYCETLSMHNACAKAEKRNDNVELKMDSDRRVGKRLTFEEDRNPSKKMAPSTPCAARSSSLGVIDICDSDDEKIQLSCVNNQGSGAVCISTDQALVKSAASEKETRLKTKRVLCQHSCEENLNNCNGRIPSVPTPKRKRASNIVKSDSENEEDDDDVPICNLKRMHLQEIISGQTSPELKTCSETGILPGDDDISNIVTPPRRRLVSLRKREGQKGTGKGSSSKTIETKRLVGIPTTEDAKDDESEEAESSSEGDSLGGFIVDSTDVSNDDDSSDDEDDSDDNEDFGEILSRIKRRKDQKSAWEFEADMLADFGKDPELCMKAVCALYRQQTSEEKISKGTLVNNLRGFSKFDANRGSNLAQFLIDGDPECDLKKSVEDLQHYDPKGIEKCRTFATRYSKQLFEIYKNKEDPLFLPS